MLRNWRFWLGVAISIIFLVLALRGQDFGQIRRALGEADYRLLPPALLLYFVGVWGRALRWRILLRPVGHFSASALYPIIVIGYMANNVLPLRLGELVRAYALRERAGAPASATLATIAVERLCDGLTMLGFLLFASLFIPLNAELRRLAFVAATVFAVLLVVLVAVVLSNRLHDRLLGLAVRILPLPEALTARLIAVVEGFVKGLRVLRSGRDLAAVTLLSVLVWGFEAGLYLTIAPAFRLPVRPAGALLTTAVANLSTLIPSSPAYIGVFESAVVLVLNGVLGIASELALSYALVVHAALYLPITLWGLYYWARGSLSWGEVRAAGGGSVE